MPPGDGAVHVGEVDAAVAMVDNPISDPATPRAKILVVANSAWKISWLLGVAQAGKVFGIEPIALLMMGISFLVDLLVASGR